MIKETASVVAGQGAMAEARLWQAVITNTIQEWLSGPLRRRREAEEYLFNDAKDFPLICESAGMDVGRLRAKLLKLRDKAIHGAINGAMHDSCSVAA